MGLFDFKKAKRERPLVILVDDEAALRELWGSFLADLGCDAVKFDDGHAAIKAVKDQKPDLVLLDINMPKMNGLAVLSELKANPVTKPIPVLMLTGEQKGKDVESAFARGAAGYLIKPPDYVRFCEKVKAILIKQGFKFDPPTA